MTKNIDHWNRWAKKYGKSSLATTKHQNIKEIEVSIIEQIIRKNFNKQIKILELGCGNGINLKSLSKIFKFNKYTGIDYSRQMIENAKKNNKNKKNIRCILGDVTKKDLNFNERFDFIFTNRCLINIFSQKKVMVVLQNIKKNLKPNGKVLFLENFIDGHTKQNELRKILSQRSRTIARYNKFLDLNFFLTKLRKSFKIIKTSNYSSLYDLILYVLLPSLNKGKTDYKNPVLKKLAKLIINYQRKYNHILGTNINLGQNSYIFAKKRKL